MSEAGRRDSGGAADSLSAVVFDIQRYSLHDGPGIRTTVFLKGCPLRCAWCANPESQSAHPEILHRNSRCTKCGACLPACALGAIVLDECGVVIDRARCNNCGQCVASCSPAALEMAGAEMTVGAVFEEVMRDELFYRTSQGGVTISGGEPLAHADFAAALFRRCRKAGIHTCIETSGYSTSSAMRKVLPLTDLVIFDLKLLDERQHRRYTRVSNRRVLENAKLVIGLGRAVLFRIPLIPGVNDDAENLVATAQFVKGLAPGGRIELMPYHRFGAGKYAMLDRQYLFAEAIPQTEQQLRHASEIIRSCGVACEVVL